MRIAHVTSWYVPGLGYEENYLPFAQAKAGHEVALVTAKLAPREVRRSIKPPEGLSKRQFQSARTEEGTVLIRRLPCTPEYHGQILLPGLGQALRQIRPDVVYSHGSLSPISIQCLLHQPRLGYRLFIDDHSHQFNLGPMGLLGSAYAKSVALLYQRYDAKVAGFLPVTPAAKETLLSILGLSKEKILPASLGVDAGTFAPSKQKRNQFRKTFGLDSKDILIITAGKFGPRKKFEMLIAAFSKLQSGTQNLKLMIVGDGSSSYSSSLRRTCAALEMTDRVFFPGFVSHDRLADFYNGADIGAWPGSHSITVLEAFSTGLPCVLPASEPAYHDIFSYGNACLPFARDDTRGLGLALGMLANNPTSRQEISIKARRLVDERFSWNVVADRLLNLYRGLGPVKLLPPKSQIADPCGESPRASRKKDRKDDE